MGRLKTVVYIIFLLILPVCSAYSGQTGIRILYLNDFHGFAESSRSYGSDEMRGGIAYLAAKVEKLRNEKPSLLLSGGDMIQGDNWANLFQGESVIELMNIMRFDAMVAGNHEFDFGQEVLKRRISQARFAVLGANVEGMDLLKPYIIKDLNGIRIAIIGVVTEDTASSTHPKNVSGLKFLSLKETVGRYVRELKDRTDMLIVLSHNGLPADMALAAHVDNIDVIVGGHSHTKIEQPVIEGKTVIVQAWEHAKALGVLDISFEGGKIIKVEGHLEEVRPEAGKEDRIVQPIVEKYSRKIDAALNETLGYAALDLDGENVRIRETNMGDFVADIVRHASSADMALINGGGIRTGIKKGGIRLKDIYSVLPFDNYIVAVKLTGRQIRESLEHGVSAVEEGAGRFPQVSGISFKYSRLSPAGSRVTEILIKGEPLDPGRDYVVATNDFLAAGGDDYKAFGEAVRGSRDFEVIGGMMKGEMLVYINSGTWLRDVVADYIREKKIIAPVVNGRIIEVR